MTREAHIEITGMIAGYRDKTTGKKEPEGDEGRGDVC